MFCNNAVLFLQSHDNTISGEVRRYRADAVPGWQCADEGSRPLQHGAGAGGRSLQLGTDGVTDGGHVRLQHGRQETRHVHRHARHGTGALPAAKHTQTSRLH